MWRKCLATACGLLLAGCETKPIGSAFQAKEAAFVLDRGTGRIDGQAFLRRDYGKLVTAAGERVFLIPATPYTLARFKAMFDGDFRSYFGHAVEAPPADYYRYRREAKVDMRGKFVFEDLAAGRYIVATRVFWEEPGWSIMKGGGIFDVVEVRRDETTLAVISGK